MDAAEITQLTDGEREVLFLLGEGHTAKSIAATLNLSIHSVNDRLRDARRKTGAASSRELARFLRDQENRTKEIGLPPCADAEPVPSASGATMVADRVPWSMTIMILAAAAGLGALVMNAPPTPSSDDQTKLVHPVPKLSFGELDQRLDSDGVDAAWAPEAENKISALYGTLPGLTVERVQCGRTMCKMTADVADRNAMKLASGNPPFLQELTNAGLWFRASGPDADGRSFQLFLQRSGTI